MSVGDIPILPHELLCQSPIYNDNRWDVRPQFYRTGTAADVEWIRHPMQPPYLATDTPLMSYDLTIYKNAQGGFKPEVSPDPCIPYHTRYCSFNRTAWQYDHDTPSLVVPSLPCRNRGRTTLPDVACEDQEEFMARDPLSHALHTIHTT